MGSGLAKVLRERYPKVWDDYAAHADAHGLHLGELIWSVNDPHVVINAITQENYGRDGALYADYEAILEVFLLLDAEAKRTQDHPYCAELRGGVIEAVAMPLIGCGLAGGDWTIVKEIIETTATNYQPVVYLNGQGIP
jgi:O-acetyl-ADP-ribose deacetylase (regulator of RNase III)